MVADQSTFATPGPTSPIVTTTFAFRFGEKAGGRTLRLTVSADNDAGLQSELTRVGRIKVKRAIP